MRWKPVSERCSTKDCPGERRPGGRYCRACHNDPQVAYRARRRDKIAALVKAARDAGIDVTEWTSGMETV